MTVASAQSNVQVYGQVGAGVNYNQASGGGIKRSVTQLGDNLMWNSFLGFSGTEDLGGGLRALFRMETALAPDTGVAGGMGAGGDRLFNRQSWVGIGAGGSTLTLGRQFHAGVDRVVRTLDVNRAGGSNLQVVPLALFGVNRFVGNDNRVDNSIKYRYSKPGLIEAGVSYGMDEKVRGVTPAVAPTSGASYSFDLAHTTKQYDIGVMHIHYDAPSGLANGTTPGKSIWALGGSVQLGNFKPYLSYFDSTFDSTVLGRLEQRNKIWDVGLNWTPMVPVTVTVAYYHDKGESLNGVRGRDGKKQTFVLAGFYALSKRTELYSAYYQNKFSDGYTLEPVNQAAMNRTAAQDKVQGVSVGIRHFF